MDRVGYIMFVQEIFMITSYHRILLHFSDQFGICIFSNTTACDDWAFERGACDTTNPNFSVYCADNGGQVSQENVDWGEVMGAPPATYGVCTSNGKECTEYDYYAYNNCSFVDPMTIGQPINGCMGSPDGCYCSDNGYTMSPTLYEPTGGEYALCIFSDDAACDSWAYFRGECDTSNPNFQVYCKDNGGELSKNSVEWGEVEGTLPAEYEVCTTDNAECTENGYYTTGCADTTVPSSTGTATATEAVGQGLSATKVPMGESAQFDCPEGSFCCVEGAFGSLSGGGDMVLGGDSSCSAGNIKVTSGLAADCGSDDCVITCTGLCDVKVVGDAGVVEETPPDLAQPPVGILDSNPSESSGSNVLCHGHGVVPLVLISLQIFDALV